MYLKKNSLSVYPPPPPPPQTTKKGGGGGGGGGGGAEGVFPPWLFVCFALLNFPISPLF